MENNFCKALVANDRVGLQKIVDNYLGKLHAKSNQQENFESIKTWIASYDCIKSVESNPYLLDTEPPVKEFVVFIKGSDRPISIGIVLHADQWKFNVK